MKLFAQIRAKTFLSRRSTIGNGFTFIELMVAIIILMVGVVAVAQLIPGSLSTDLKNRNDSTAVISAQRLIEQVSLQSLTATTSSCANGNPPSGSYAFCDVDGDPIATGAVTTNGTTTSNGCSLNSAGQIDFTQPTSNCGTGYWVDKSPKWNPATGTTITTELRWRVVTLRTSTGSPYRKLFIVGGRTGNANFSFATANMQFVVGP